MNTTQKYFAYLCAVLFIVSAVVALFSFNIEWHAFDAKNYKRAFENQNLYQRMPDILAGAVFASIANDQNPDPYLQALTRNDWREVIASVLLPEQTKLLTDNALDVTFNYINGKSDSATISLAPIKQNLTGQGGMQVMILILHAQPACTAEQLLQIGLGFLTGNITLCNVPPEMMNLITPLLESQAQALSFAFPDEISIIPNSAAAELIKLNRVRAILKIIPIFPLFFLFCLTLIAVRSISEGLKWWGWSLLITGFVTALSAWIGAPVFSTIAQRIVQGYGAGFIPPILFSIFGEAVRAVATEILKPVIYQGLIVLFCGLGLVIVEFAWQSLIKMRSV